MDRIAKGLISTFSIAGVPLGSWWCRSIASLQTTARYEHGLVIVLPGIEGKSAINLGIARGLNDAGVPHAIEVLDWTTGWLIMSLYHLRSPRQHAIAIDRITQRIRAYKDSHPDRPLVVVAHSGGAGVLLRALEQLPDGCKIKTGVLLAAATSPRYDLSAAMSHVEQTVWSFSSLGDLLQLGIGTLLFGTIDAQHCVAAGNCGFRSSDNRLRQMPYRSRMATSLNLAGHLGCANRLFVADYIAPLVE